MIEMKLLEVKEFSPSFTGMSPEAVDYAIEHGAAKIEGFLSEGSVRRLEIRGISSTPSRLIERVPELLKFFRVLHVPIAKSRRINSQIFPCPASFGVVHTDENARNGLSLIMPLFGGKAVFGASNQEFTDNDIPDYVVEYAEGDVMIVRQAIRSVDGVPVNLGQAYHIGVAERYRELAAVDYLSSQIVINRRLNES